MIIRAERPADRPDILALLGQAFPGTAEVKLVRELYASRDYLPALSLLAESERGEVLGYVISTRAWIGAEPSLGLGPLAVLPGYQGQGIGSSLMHASIAAAAGIGERSIVLLGSTDFYPRFGFVPADSLGIISPDPSWGSHFMALTLGGSDGVQHGSFRYADPFNHL